MNKKLLIVIGIVLGCIFFCNTNYAYGTNEIEDGTYEIYTTVSDTKVIDIEGASHSNMANVYIFERSNVNNQKFRFESNSDGTFTIFATHSNKVLDVQNGGKTNGTNVWQYQANGSDAQKWYLKKCSDGSYNIVSKLNDLYLDINGGSSNNRSNIQVYAGNGTNAQKFRIIPLYNTEGKKSLDDGIYKIYSKVADNRVLEVPNLSLMNQTILRTAMDNNKINQRFKLKYNNDGTYTITVLHSKKALDVRGAGGTNYTPVQQYDSNNTNAQKWILIKNNDNTYSIISKCNGLTLDIYGGSSAVGSTLQTYRLNGTNAQKFTFERQDSEVAPTKSTENGIFRILSVINANKVFDIASGSKENGAKLQMWDTSKVSQQRFDIQYDREGYCKIRATHSNKVLTVESTNPNAGSNITQQQDKNLDTQKWIIEKIDENKYSIVSKCGNLYLEIASDNVQNGIKIILNDETKLDTQQFILVNETPNENLGQIEDGIYQIETKSGKVLDVAGGSENDHANIQIWKNDKVQQQKYRITRVESTDYYKINAIHSVKYLNSYNGRETLGTNVEQLPYNNSNSQFWYIQKTDDGYYKIISKANGLVLDVYAGQINNNGANVQLYYFNNSNAQKFKITPINILNNNTYEIETKINSNKVVDIAGGSNAEEANVQIWDADNVNQQRFIFESLSTDTYKITAKHSNKALTVNLSNNNVYQKNYDGTTNQKWQIIEAGDNYYTLKSVANNLVLDVYAGQANNGQNVSVYESNGTNAQKFKFVPGFRKFIQEGTYGRSGLAYAGDGRATNLKYYKIGKGSKVLFAGFSIHGFEDSYDHDGAELTYIAEQFKNYLYNSVEESIVNNWTIYILPNLNPDGQTYGWTKDGPGRTTLYSEAPAHKGIDMNRNWSVGYSRQKSDRNYNGTAPFQAYEARLLRDFILSHQGSNNIVIDTHGWLNETMGDNGLGSYYRNQFGLPKHIATYGQGYFINWARTLTNSRSVLVELPEVKNHNQTVSWGYVNKFINATMQLLREN